MLKKGILSIAGALLVFLAFMLFDSHQAVFGVCEFIDSDDINVLQQAQEDCQKEREARMPAQNKNKEDLARLEKNLETTKKLIQAIESQLNNLEKEIFNQEIELGYQKEIFAARVRDYYKKSRGYSLFTLLLTSPSANILFRGLSYRQSVAANDRRIILEVSQKLKELNDNKDKLKTNISKLNIAKDKLAQDTKNLAEEVKEVEDYFSQIDKTIAALSAKQQAILTARSGTFTSSVGEVPVSNIPCSGPPGSPSFCDPGGGTWFATFSFGAWTHRKGMSQYGAKGRADNGQNYEQILQAYYGKTPVSKDTGGTISVDGYGNLDFEGYYLLGIAEMPSSWNGEALKAQAIAARTYAYRYKVEGRTICTTQSCQVFSKSKADSPPAAWKEAVESTRGKVLEDVVTYYSSTAGGYLTTSGWDTTDSQGGAGFASRAWESKAGSPWFYSSWFTQNYTSGSAKCNRSHPWLNQEEMADILNAWLVLNKQGGDDRILPITINQCPISGISGNPYSMAELRDKANSLGGAFTSVSSASVTYSNAGETSSVSFGTNKGTVSISGADFKQAFNLRAPGYIAIRSPLFNIEQK